MKAYMIRTKKKIEPFGDHPGDCLISNNELKAIQKSVLDDMALNLAIVEDNNSIKDSEEHIIFTDSLYFNRKLLETFISESRKTQQRTVCALHTGVTTLRTVVNTQDVTRKEDSVEYQLWYVPIGATTDESRPVILNPDKFYESLPMPQHMFGLPEYRVPLPDKIAVQIDHWVNLWAANIASLLGEVSSIKGSSKFKLLGLAARAFSTNQWKILRKTNHIGHNCDIHPSAWIEGSIIGDNVRIGAGTVVRESKIGNNCNLENGVVINFSVLGENCYLGDGAVVRYSVMYPGSFTIASLLSCSIIGRDTFKGDGVVLTDFRFDGQPIKVVKNGTVIDTENTFIGSCLGHNVYLGSGTIIASGRAIPNGLRILPENSRFVRKLDTDGIAPGFQKVYPQN